MTSPGWRSGLSGQFIVVPDPDTFLLKLHEGIPDIVRQANIIINLKILQKPLLHFLNLPPAKRKHRPLTIHLMIKKDKNIILQSPERILQELPNNNLINNNLMTIPYLNIIIFATSNK